MDDQLPTLSELQTASTKADGLGDDTIHRIFVENDADRKRSQRIGADKRDRVVQKQNTHSNFNFMKRWTSFGSVIF